MERGRRRAGRADPKPAQRKPHRRRRRTRPRGAAARHPPRRHGPCPKPSLGPWWAPRARAAGQWPGRKAGSGVRVRQEVGQQAARRAARPTRPAGAEPGRGLAPGMCTRGSLFLAAMSVSPCSGLAHAAGAKPTCPAAAVSRRVPREERAGSSVWGATTLLLSQQGWRNVMGAEPVCGSLSNGRGLIEGSGVTDRATWTSLCPVRLARDPFSLTSSCDERASEGCPNT